MIGKATFVAVLGFAAAYAGGAFAEEGPAPGPKGPGGPGGARRGDAFFARHDADRDGKVTLDELVAPMKELLAAGDADGDGALTPEELDRAREKLRAERAEEGRPGPDGEGRPGGGPEGRPGRGPDGRPGGGPEGRPGGGPEGRPGGGPGGPGGPGGERPDPEEIFRRMDANADGVISLEEFRAAHERMRPGGGDRRGPPHGGRGR